MAKALGIIEVQGYSVALAVMDAACKAADITIEGIDCNSPAQGDQAPIPLAVQVKFTGTVADVKVALEIAQVEAAKHSEQVDMIAHLIPAAASGIEDLLSTGKVKQK